MFFHLFPNAFKSNHSTLAANYDLHSWNRGSIDLLRLTDLRSGANITGNILFDYPGDNLGDLFEVCYRSGFCVAKDFFKTYLLRGRGGVI